MKILILFLLLFSLVNCGGERNFNSVNEPDLSRPSYEDDDYDDGSNKGGSSEPSNYRTMWIAPYSTSKNIRIEMRYYLHQSIQFYYLTINSETKKLILAQRKSDLVSYREYAYQLKCETPSSCKVNFDEDHIQLTKGLRQIGLNIQETSAHYYDNQPFEDFAICDSTASENKKIKKINVTATFNDTENSRILNLYELNTSDPHVFYQSDYLDGYNLHYLFKFQEPSHFSDLNFSTQTFEYADDEKNYAQLLLTKPDYSYFGICYEK